MADSGDLEKDVGRLNKKIDLLTQAVKQSHVIKEKFNESTKLLKAKDKELRELNNSLEDRVKKAIEENKEKTQILNHQSKMASMGEMIGNIAHQWRQPLSVISTAASGVQVQKQYGMLTDDMLDDSLGSIVKSTQFLSETIDDFRNFFSSNKERANFILSKPVIKSVELVKSALKNNDIDIFINLDESLEVNGFENEFIQAVINIINNAKDALKENIKKYDEKFIFIDLYQDKDLIILDIKDNAGGISPNIIEKVFEPYFTTKHKSQGTGIGLYMTSEIVVKHFMGALDVSNETYTYNNKEYTGASFKISLDKV